jgi:hypothetical protein
MRLWRVECDRRWVIFAIGDTERDAEQVALDAVSGEDPYEETTWATEITDHKELSVAEAGSLPWGTEDERNVAQILDAIIAARPPPRCDRTIEMFPFPQGNPSPLRR